MALTQRQLEDIRVSPLIDDVPLLLSEIERLKGEVARVREEHGLFKCGWAVRSEE